MKNKIITKIIIIMIVIYTIIGSIFVMISYENSFTKLYNTYSSLSISLADLIAGHIDENKVEVSIDDQQNYIKQQKSVDKIKNILIYEPDVKNNKYKVIFTTSDKNKIGKTFYNYDFSNKELCAINGEPSKYGELNNDKSILSCYSPVMKNDKVIAIVQVNIDFNGVMLSVHLTTLKTVFFVVVILGLGIVVTALILKFGVFKKLNFLTKQMNNLVNIDYVNTKFEPVDIHSSDEVGMLANAYNKMGNDLQTHINNLMQIKAVQEQEKTTAETAQKIQMGLLPKSKFNTVGMDLFAQMKPAKIVGGDFFDYFYVDKDNVCVVIADVSGKGITAALFMANAKAIIHDMALRQKTPSEVLAKVNNILCDNNPEQMFITIFVAMFNIDNGLLRYSSAGHNPPIAIVDDKLYHLKADGVAIGLFEDEEYEEKSMYLTSNDLVFLYTDGVTESINKNSQLFGMNRLENLIYSNKDVRSFQLVDCVYKTLEKFSQDREQSDDITMLAFNVCKSKRINVAASVDNLQILREAIENQNINKKYRLKVHLIVEEIFVNICNYSNKENKTTNVIFEISVSCNAIVLRFADDGINFNPLKVKKNIETYDMDTEKGGLGIFLTKKYSDKVTYEYINDNNILTILINTKGDSKNDN